MKKLTLLAVLLFAFVLTYGQRVSTNRIKAQPYGSELMTPVPEPTESGLKAGGDIFFSETFDWADNSERGWSLPAGWQIVEETDFGCPWIWRAGTDSIKGLLTFEPGHAYSKSPEDGYLVLPMDEYNYKDGVSTSNGATVWFQLPPIDCSTHPGVLISFRQFFRCYYTPDCRIQVSNDLGAHWANYSVLFETPISIFCKNPYPEVNISEVAAGMPEVWIRFLWNSMERYFWCIDDIELMESYDNDILLENSWQYMVDLSNEDTNESYCYMIPNSQIGADNFGGYYFRGAIMNVGMADQEGCKVNVEIFKNGTSVYNQTSEARDIWTIERDTFDISTVYNPTGYGDYKMVLTAQTDQADGRMTNNVYTDTFYVTDSIYSLCDYTWEEHASTAAWGNNDGDWMGIAYDIKQPCEANSISCAIMQRPKNRVASTQPGYYFQYWLYKWDATEGVWVDKITSEYTEVTPAMIDSWVTLPLQKDGESEFMEPGYYIAAIQTFHGGGAGASNRIFRFTIGADQGHRYAYGKTLFRRYNEETWNSGDELEMIRLNINNTGAPKTADVVFNVDMTVPIANGIFSPGADFVDVSGTFNAWGSTQLTDADGDKIYSLTVPAMTLFQSIQYKYRINGTTPEFPTTGKNRDYRISYYNMLADVFNNGVSLGVDVNTLSSSVSVYPNPASDNLNISIVNAKPTDTDVVITSLHGQVVYRTRLQSVIDYTLPVDLSGFAKGLYLLKVNDTVTKVVID